jgi:hypothetical protein
MNSQNWLIVPSRSRGDWLLQQHLEKRRYRRIGWTLALVVLKIIVAASVLAWWFGNRG